MKLIEHFDEVLVLDGGTGGAGVLVRELQARQTAHRRIDLSDPEPWGEWLCSSTPGAPRSIPDVLVLDGTPIDGDGFWSSQDGLVEELECCASPMAVLVHDDGRCARTGPMPSRLLPSDGVPTRPRAVAFARGFLRQMVELVPRRGAVAPRSAEDWLVLALWLAPSLTGSPRRPLAWPSLASA